MTQNNTVNNKNSLTPNSDITALLSKKYKVLCCADLAEITYSPDKIYQILHQHHKSVFEPDERIVFYSQYCPSDELILHIIKAALLIDISNSFILICCSGDIQENAARICSNLGFADDIISTDQISVRSLPLQENFNLPKSLCPIPWNSIEVRNNGHIFPCCISQAAVGDINNTSIHDAFNNQQMNLLRTEFLQGIKPTTCKKCWIREDKNLISNRNRHSDYLLKNTLITGLDKPQIKNVDLKLGITCNFKCRICGPESSSVHVEEEAKFKNITFVISKNWVEDPNKLLQLENLLPTLTNIDMYGGEPFLLKSFSKVLQLAVDGDYAKNIRLHYNTNGSVYPTNLINYWKHFREIDIHFSIDNIGKKFELERGGSWKEVEANILKIKNLQLDNIKLSIMPAISIMNIFYLGDVLSWAQSHNLDVNPIYVTYPIGYDLSQLTGAAKQILTKKYSNHPWPEMTNILESIIKNPNSDGAEFIKLTKHFDTLRNENFAETHPEIAFAMGYSV